MYPELEALLYQAEHQYLTSKDLKTFKSVVAELAPRLALYEKLRDLEADLFEALVLQLQSSFPDVATLQLTQVLRHWILVFRYSAMAMLLNHPQFLQRRLLEWLTDIVQTHQVVAVEAAAANVLLTQLVNRLTPEQIALLHPYLEQAQTTLLSGSASAPEAADPDTEVLV